jgi:hypothetical protein
VSGLLSWFLGAWNVMNGDVAMDEDDLVEVQVQAVQPLLTPSVLSQWCMLTPTQCSVVNLCNGSEITTAGVNCFDAYSNYLSHVVHGSLGPPGSERERLPVK